MTELTLAGARSNYAQPSYGAQPIQGNDFLNPNILNRQNPSLAGGGMQLGGSDGLNLGTTVGESPGGGFDWGGAMSNFSMGAQGVMGLANAYTAYKQLGLMEDQLSMQGNIANRDIANRAATTNRLLEDRASMAAQMTSGADYGTEAHLAAKKKLQTTVDGSPVT